MKRAAFRIAKSEGQASSIVNQLKGAGFAENDIRFFCATRGLQALRPWSTTKRLRGPQLEAAAA